MVAGPIILVVFMKRHSKGYIRLDILIKIKDYIGLYISRLLKHVIDRETLVKICKIYNIMTFIIPTRTIY